MKPQIAEYRALLISEATLSTLRRALVLSREILGGAIVSRQGEIAVEWTRKRLSGVPIDRPRALKLSALRAAANKRRASKRNRELESLVMEVAVHLAVATQVAHGLTDKKHSFFLDASLLVMQQAYSALLPELGEGWQAEREELLISFTLFAESLPRAADRFYLLGMIAEAEENLPAAAEYYAQVVAATPADEHDFMTCLQTAWGSLVEQNRHKEAFTFLVQNSSRITRSNWDEFTDLLQSSFDLAAQSNGVAGGTV